MLPRFFVPDLDPGASDARLPPDEARHLSRVMRLGVGDEIAVFDGRGRECRARVTDVARDAVRVQIEEPLVPAPEPRIALTLVQALLKGDRMDEVVRDATMMGVAAIAPLVTGRTIARRQSVERWERVAVASAKQCRRAVVPRIGRVVTPEEWLGETTCELKLLLVEPAASGREGASMRELRDRPHVASVAVIVGPEGGWAPEERDALVTGGCTPVTLGGLTLRADAVAIVAISLARFALGDL